MTSWFQELLHDHLALTIRADRILIEQQTIFQNLLLFENKDLGKVLILDNAIQTSTADEFMYHEMMAHVPLFAHQSSHKDVLIIGGGDGGVLRQCLRHSTVKTVVHCEIDQAVINICRTHIPEISNHAFTDSRTLLTISDGAKYVAETEQKFDVIIIDSTDPGGPSTSLFTATFYTNCKRCLRSGGIFVNQSGTPFLQAQSLHSTYQHLRTLFVDAWFYLTSVPTYIGGHLAIGWATDNPSLRQHTLATLQQRFQKAEISYKILYPRSASCVFRSPTVHPRPDV